MNSQCNLLLPCFYTCLFSLLVIFSPVLSLSTFNITKDSSLSTDNGSRYWLSPNGIFAFGFYPIGVQDGIIQYNVGIWNHKSSKKPLVWTADGDHHCAFSGPSSLIFSKKGNLVRISDTNKILMVSSIEDEEIATSAIMYDNGNFVLYNSKGNVVWESFNYPSDTILPGQTFKSGSTLVTSGKKYKLIIDKDGNVNLRDNKINDDLIVSTIYRSKFMSKCVEMKLTSNGQFILIDRNGIIIKNLEKKDELIDGDKKNGTIMYRAKLDSDGYFRLYVDEISANIEKSWKIIFWNEKIINIILLGFSGLALTLFTLVMILTKEENTIQPAAPMSKSSESMAGPHKKTEVLQTLRYRDVSA